MSVATIQPRELHEIRNAGKKVTLIDVRTPKEYQEVHAQGARLIPLDQLDPQVFKQERNGSGEPLYLICRSGSRGKQACEKLIAAGLAEVVNVEGGTLAWDQAGLPVVRGQKMVSLERQVRIAAGALVLIGAVLALAVDPWFALLPGVMGAGLVFAGVTDTCGMGMMLAKMPWNQVKPEEAAKVSCCVNS